MQPDTDEFWMTRAMAEAVAAGAREEVPIGACLISADGELLAAAGNRTREDNDPTGHAEIIVMREAAAKIGNYRLTGTTLYTTIEPCAMCAGALVHARVSALVYAAPDRRYGAVDSVFRLCSTGSLNHQLKVTTGVMGEDARRLMQDFFRCRRTKNFLQS
jgi:tRNA(adenine34) deaminase